MRLLCLLVTIIALSQSQNLVAQEIFSPSPNREQLQANPITRLIKVDGKLDEAEWLNASTATNFKQVEPIQGMNSQSATKVKVLYTPRSLYVGVFLADSLGKKNLRATDLKRDFNWRDHDTFALCVDGFNDKRNSMSFATNPYGAQKDYLSFDDTFFDGDWNGLWKVRTTRTDSGWVAEFEIPWKTLRYPRLRDSTSHWGINFLRLKRSANEISAWSPYPRSFGFNRVEYAGLLTNLKPPRPSTNLQINPYVLSMYRKREGSAVGYTEQLDVKYGGELKWALNSNTVLDLTANTDFAQADADVQVNNISRFSVFFPEKRQFFLENASLFGVGLSPAGDLTGGNMVIQPFFSRKIGLDDLGNPIPVTGGARLVYRSVQRNMGGIAMHQQASGASPVSDFVVGRYSENFGKQNRIGGLLTMKITDTTKNILGSIDGFFRFSKASSLQTMVMQTTSSGGKGIGYGGYAQFLYTTNNLRFWWTQSIVTKSFNPELGFVSRMDVIGTTPGFFFNYRGKLLPYRNWIRSFAPGATTEFYHQASSGKLIERSIAFYPVWINFQNGAYFRFSTGPAYQNLLTSFKPLGIEISSGEYHYVRSTFAAGSDPSRKISVSGSVESGSYYDGSLNTVTVGMNVIPIPHIALNFNFNQNEFRDVGMEKKHETINLFTATARFALNPRLQLVGLYQKNSQDDRDFYNLRLAWEYKPLSYIYLVLNSRTYTTTSIQQEQTGIVKLTFLKQF